MLGQLRYLIPNLKVSLVVIDLSLSCLFKTALANGLLIGPFSRVCYHTFKEHEPTF